MVKRILIVIILISIFSSIEAEGERRQRQKSALKWITKDEVQNLPGGWTNRNLVRNDFLGGYWMRTICRVEVGGCFYPGFPEWDGVWTTDVWVAKAGNKSVSLKIIIFQQDQTMDGLIHMAAFGLGLWDLTQNHRLAQFIVFLKEK